jgi:membrane-associated phospholipid phosphatase
MWLHRTTRLTAFRKAGVALPHRCRRQYRPTGVAVGLGQSCPDLPVAQAPVADRRVSSPAAGHARAVIIIRVPPPLIRPHLRRYAVAAMACGAVLTGVLAAIVFHGSSTSFDARIGGALYRHLGPGWVGTLLGFSEPVISFVLLGVIVVLAGVHRRWDVVLLAVIGPSLALVITELALKPLVGRAIGSSVNRLHVIGSYPSGHETGVTSTALVVLIACAQLRVPRRGRALLVTVLIAWAVVAALGLVRGFLHYTTDTIGALGVAAVAVLGTALAIDRVSSPAARNLPSTSRAT